MIGDLGIIDAHKPGIGMILKFAIWRDFLDITNAQAVGLPRQLMRRFQRLSRTRHSSDTR